MRRAARAAAIVVVFVITTSALALALTVYRPHPILDGDLRTIGMHERGEILRDRYGVPHIFARNAHDLFYMQGYVLAQDRLFQMDLYRRAAHGRLSEVLGRATLEADKLTRTLSLSRAAQRDVEQLSADGRAALDAFAAGVNKYIEQHGESLPLEFVLLGYRPGRWTGLDSLAIMKLQAYDQSTNFETELLRARVAQRIGIAAVPALFPEPAGTPPLDAAWQRIAPYLSTTTDTSPSGREALRAIIGDTGLEGGSNCWALAGSRTATGRPLLAGDPHIGVRNPSIWYEVALHGAGYEVVGFTIPGVPGVVLGHNERIAWSLTVAYLDQQDLYLERSDPAAAPGSHLYLHGDHSEAATIHREQIAIKGQKDPLPFDVAETRHGPIITPVVKGISSPLALRWTALDGGRSLDGILALDRARDWDSFLGAVALADGPALTMCYADVEGHIGYALAGRVAFRASAEDGRLPLPGWTGTHEWQARRGGDRSPQPPAVLDPPDGLVVIANQRWTDLSGAGSTAEWDPGFRGARARSVLEGARDVTVEDLRRLQGDVAAMGHEPTRDLVVAARRRTLDPVASPNASAALGVLAEWDGSLAADSAGAAVYETVTLHLLRTLLEPVLGAELLAAYLADARPVSALRVLIASPQAPAWRDVFAGRALDQIVAQALELAAGEIVTRSGTDPRGWRWGRLHRITFAHPLGAAIPLGTKERPQRPPQ